MILLRAQDYWIPHQKIKIKSVQKSHHSFKNTLFHAIFQLWDGICPKNVDPLKSQRVG